MVASVPEQTKRTRSSEGNAARSSGGQLDFQLGGHAVAGAAARLLG